jgi:hypothetical protein
MKLPMLFRVVFWLGFVGLLMPHGNGVGEFAGSAAAALQKPSVDVLPGAMLARLSAIQDDIEAAERTRFARRD